MDYDDHLRSCAIFNDAKILCQELPSGSVVVVTAGAINKQFDEEDAVKQTSAEAKPEARLKAMKDAFGDLLPTVLPEGPMGARTFPKLAGSILFNCLEHATLDAARADGTQFMPLFHFGYSDGAPMVTVAGMLANESDAKKLKGSPIRNLSYIRGKDQVEIDVPPLTLREKWAIDGLLPSHPHPTPEAFKAKFNFGLRPSQLAAYCEYYRHYPIYSELYG